MFQKTLKRILIGLGLAAVLLASSGCDEVAGEAAAQEQMRTAGPLQSLETNPFVVGLDIPFYIRF